MIKILKHQVVQWFFRFIVILLSLKDTILKKHSLLFTLRESGCSYEQQDTPISGSCVHKSMPKLAIDYYGFALGRLGSGASSTFAQLG